MKLISSGDIQYKKPLLNEFIVVYNDKLANILVNNFSMKYLSSAAINRLEAETKLYEFLEKYIQISELLDSDIEIYVQISKEDQILYELLNKKYGKRIIGKRDYYFLKSKLLFFPKLIILLFINLLFSIISRLKDIKEKEYDYVVRTYFDHRSIDEDECLRDEYFGDLINDLKRNGKLLVVYKMIRRSDFVKFLKTKSCGFDAVSLEYFLSFFKTLNAFKSFLYSRIILNEKFIYKNYDCTELLQLFINKDYLTFRGLDVFIEKEIAIKLFDLNPKTILFPYENQTWEKMYPYVKDILKSDTKITGYQHTGVSYKLLNYFPSKIEKHLPIFPDKIATVGIIINNLLLEQANYPSEIVVGGALRFKKHFLKSKSNIEISYPNKKINKKIVYAFSYDLKKYNGILNLLIDIFGNTEINVLLKFHPDYIECDILKSFKKELPKNFMAYGAFKWDEIFPIVDLVLYDDNSIAFEGMIHGVKTFSVAETEKIYDITRKFYFNEWKENLNKNDLISIKNQLIDETFDKEFEVKKIQKYINNYFTEFNYEDYFTKFI
ncbi:MAG: hypothetical protein OIN86_14205 [Candidatus Methanoperedens sp.]|nr:hypothetical protein [Candidatus Methanoperedens sp.]CAG0969652.1 hypothetical protein METP1_01162 [Methanosarcinales archaeon]